MVKNKKAKGSRSEYKSRDLLEALGYRCTKAGGSLGEWDLIAVGPHDIILVQVKTNRWEGSEEREAMQLFPAPPNAKKQVWRWNDYARAPIVKNL